MPRPRVKPKNRKRCARACLQCRFSKKRCNAIHPCEKCIARGEAALCTFAADAGSTGSTGSIDGEKVILSEDQTTQTVQTAQRALSNPGDSSVTRPRSIMLQTSHNERVFFGSTAAISFLKFLQQIWRTYVEPNSFTEDQGTQRMLEAEIPCSLAPTEELDDSRKRRFVESYLHASSGILDLFTENDVETLLCSSSSNPQLQCPRSTDAIVDPETNHDICLDLMIAIGAQCDATDDEELQLATSYFARAQRTAFAGMLQVPTVNLARSFVLMAFYMLGACRRNSALMYIGIASSISMILGLHFPENYQHLPIQTREARLQTGKSIRVLDLICNTILGRPGSTPIIRDEREFLDGEICPNYATLCATYEIVSVLQSVVNKTTENEGIHIDAAEEFIQQLQRWSHDLPPHLRHQSLGIPDMLPTLETKRAIVGKIHLACIYYYGVIQVTQQFLVSQILPHIRGMVVEESIDERKADLATMCTEAALLMAQMCEDTDQANALLSNMCILKAWLFSSGLVLGFSLLRPHKQMDSTRQAFQSACRILGRFGQTSPQAKQYHCILTEFAEAIDAHERESRSNRPRSKTSRVERIVSFDMGNSSQESNMVEMQKTLPSPPHSGGSNVNIDGQSQPETFHMDDLTWQWDWSSGAGDNEILRMFLDPCLDNLLNIPGG